MSLEPRTLFAFQYWQAELTRYLCGMAAAWDSDSNEATDAMTPEVDRASTAWRTGARGNETSTGNAPISPLRASPASATDTRALTRVADMEPGTASTGALSMCAPLNPRAGRGVSRPASASPWRGSPSAQFMIGCRNGGGRCGWFWRMFGFGLEVGFVLFCLGEFYSNN